VDPVSGTTTLPGSAEIAAALEAHGRFVFRLSPLPHQRMVDLHWAAHRAGVLLGIKVRVVVEGPVRPLDPEVTIVVAPRPPGHKPIVVPPS
jgi:hypothetical protein